MIIQGVYYPSDFEGKKAIIELGKRMNEKGYAIAGDGSLSVRVGPNAIWITVADADKGNLTQEDLVRIDKTGKQAMTSKPKQLPEDIAIHLRLYNENTEVSAILHGYPEKLNLLSMEGKSLDKAMFSPAARRLGKMECLSTASFDALSMQVAAISKTAHGVLFQNDGCMTWGKTLGEAYQSLEAANMVAGVQSLKGNQSAGCNGCCKCNGDCKNCSKQCSDRKAIFEDVPRENVESSLPGVTPLIRPGENGFSLPRGKEEAPKPESRTPVYQAPKVEMPASGTQRYTNPVAEPKARIVSQLRQTIAPQEREPQPVQTSPSPEIYQGNASQNQKNIAMNGVVNKLRSNL